MLSAMFTVGIQVIKLLKLRKAQTLIQNMDYICELSTLLTNSMNKMINIFIVLFNSKYVTAVNTRKMV